MRKFVYSVLLAVTLLYIMGIVSATSLGQKREPRSGRFARSIRCKNCLWNCPMDCNRPNGGKKRKWPSWDKSENSAPSYHASEGFYR
ncbi:hypothetical protein HOLleu_37289 [Holothuria leucospilota]|uniref:Uncharacterized protein n=1 Tax=Holothuria leucospilota TaxID=206669 RepID=A0A9Q0YGW8_HOLLE|nr:hypothetical protein HOLleu_37289 [Holothuria leucospilota]